MEIFLIILVGIIILIVILAIIAPKKYEVSRNIKIQKPISEVFNYLKSLKKQDDWSPWAEKDPNMKKTFTGTDGEIGSVSSWVGNKEVGEGEQELMGLIDKKEIRTELRFFKPWKSVSQGFFKLTGDSNETFVIWGFIGKNKFPISIMMLFMNMEKAIGGDFESGLKKLKSIMEK